MEEAEGKKVGSRYRSYVSQPTVETLHKPFRAQCIQEVIITAGNGRQVKVQDQTGVNVTCRN